MNTEYLKKAEALCAKSEYCEADIRERLYRWGCTDKSEINDIIDHLVDDRYIDQERYARAFVHDKLLYQGWGRLKLRAMLQQKHIADSVILQALSTIDPAEYKSKLQDAIRQKITTLSADDEHLAEKVFRFCMQRGFEYEEVRKLINASSE